MPRERCGAARLAVGRCDVSRCTEYSVHEFSICDGLQQVYVYVAFLRICRGNVNSQERTWASLRLCHIITPRGLRQVLHQLPKHRGKEIPKPVEADKVKVIKFSFMSSTMQNVIIT